MRWLRLILCLLLPVTLGAWWVMQPENAHEQRVDGGGRTSVLNNQPLSPVLTEEPEPFAETERAMSSAMPLSVLEGEDFASETGPRAADDDAGTQDLASFLEFDRFMALEPVDTGWASLMEGTLESTVRTMSAPIRDVIVRCLTTQCRIVLLYQPSYFFKDDPELRDEAQLAVRNAFGEAIEPVLQAYPELRIAIGSPHMLVSRTAAEESDLESLGGRNFHLSEAVAGEWILSRAPRDSE